MNEIKSWQKPSNQRPKLIPDLSEFIEWDVRNWSWALRYWSANTALTFSNCRVLEVGTRGGGLSLWLALQGAQILATDIEPPSEAVLSLHERHGVSSAIQHEVMDGTRIPYEREFDIVIFKSVLGAIGRIQGKRSQAQAIREMHKALKPGGELFFAENLVASPLHQFCRKRFVKWGESWRYVSVQEMLEFLTPFSRVQYSTSGFAGAFGRSEMQRNCLGVLDSAIFQYATPENWKYIMFGVARK